MNKILIIGGGVSGLTAGIYAEMSGFSAVICEKHSVAGGNLTGWQRGDYHVDNCIHWLTGTNEHSKTYEMWKELGALGNVKIRKNDSLYTCESGGQELTLSRDLARLERDMLALSPSDEREIKKLIRAVRTVQSMSGIAGEGHNEKMKLSDAFAVPMLHEYFSKSAGELAENFRHPLIRSFITALISERFMSLALITIIANFCADNGDLPEGGSLPMAERMCERFRSLGGEIRLGREAVRMERSGDEMTVTFSDGSSDSADYVISAVEPSLTYGMLGIPLSKRFCTMEENKRLLRFSSVHTAFSCELENLPFKSDMIFDLPKRYAGPLRTDRLLVREFSHERSFAPAGRSIIQTMTVCGKDECMGYIRLSEDRASYEDRKIFISETVKEVLESKFRDLRGKISCIDVWTPATYKRFTGAETGSFMSFAFSGGYIPKRIDNRVKGFDNVILATQWLRLPGGLPNAAQSGREAVETVLRLEKQRSRRGKLAAALF